MPNTTTPTRPPMPNTADAALEHLTSRHGWEPQLADSTLVQAHRYAHGIDGRPDLADDHLEHAHGAPTSWPPPAVGPPAGYVEPTTRTRMRPLTGIVLGWNALMAAWIVYGLFVTAHQSSNCAGDLYADACRAGTGAGAVVAIGMILALTAVVDVILAVIWMVTKKD